MGRPSLGASVYLETCFFAAVTGTALGTVTLAAENACPENEISAFLVA